MAGVCIEKIYCDICEKNNLQTFADEVTGKVTGYCFSCEPEVAYRHNPYEVAKGEVFLSDLPPMKIKSKEEIRAEVEEIEDYPVVDVAQRKLRADDLLSFEARVSLSERDGVTPTAIYWPVVKDGERTGWHVKPLWEGGYPYNIGDTKGASLLNWEAARASGAYKLIITEGPEDMASVLKIYKKFGDEKWIPAVVSLPRGAGSVRSAIGPIAKDILRTFKEVVLCFDNDEPGHKAVKEALLHLPNAKTVVLPCKDANDCIKQGKQKAAYNALAFQAVAPTTTSLILASTLHEKARQPAPYGQFTWPWPKMNAATRGIRWGESIYVGGGVKMGKGEMRNAVAAHFIKEHDAKIFMASFEEPATKTYKMLAGKIAKRIFHDPDVPFDFEAYDAAGALLGPNAIILDRYQRARWEQVKPDIIAAASWGAKAFFIDPITNYTNGVDPATANTFLQGMAQEVAEMAVDLDAVFFLFCHLKSTEGNISGDQRQKKYAEGKYIGLGNCPHNRGGDISSDQFAGSRGMMRSCHMMIGIEGNKDPDLPPEIRNTRNIAILEDREFGVSGNFPVFWNENTGEFIEL